jgi:hypothetical protein
MAYPCVAAIELFPYIRAVLVVASSTLKVDQVCSVPDPALYDFKVEPLFRLIVGATLFSRYLMSKRGSLVVHAIPIGI